MLKYLLTVLTILVTLIFIPQSVSAATTSEVSSGEKKYLGMWQKVTLKNLLEHQAGTTTTTRQAEPTTKPSLTPKLSPTQKIKSPTPTKRPAVPTPTKRPAVPTPTKKPIVPTKTPTPKPTSAAVLPATTSDVTGFIMNEINEYRSSQGLSSVQTSTETCNFAKTRAQEISTSFNHDGFNQRKSSGTLPYANWSAITENIAMTSNYKDVVTMWKNSSGHAANMRANTPYVCVMQHGNYYAYEGMKP